jgi:hypothetical protein
MRFAVLYKSFIMSVNNFFGKIENKTRFSVSQFFSLYVLQFKSIFTLKNRNSILNKNSETIKVYFLDETEFLILIKNEGLKRVKFDET